MKLIRVTLLAPVVLTLSLAFRAAGLNGPDRADRPPLVPGFVLALLGFATLNSLGWVPAAAADVLGDISRWALLTAIAAVGMKTSLRDVLDVGGQAIALIVAETVFLAGLILAGLHCLS